jgi:hypothetical protein
MPEEAIAPPKTFGNLPLDEAVLESMADPSLRYIQLGWADRQIESLELPVPGTRVISSQAYGMSLWGRCAKIIAELPDGTTGKYFLKVSCFSLREYVFFCSSFI